MSNSVVLRPLCWSNKQNADSEGKHQALKNRATFLLVEVTGMFVAGQGGDLRWLALVAIRNSVHQGSLSRFRIHWFYTTEPKMVRASVDFTFTSCANDVTRAILIGAEVGTAAMDFLWLVGLRRIE